MMDPNFTRDEFLAWARGKNPDEEYDYLSNRNCPVAQFLKETGRSMDPNVESGDWIRGEDRNVYYTFPELVEDAVLSDRPRYPFDIRGVETFRALVQRLEFDLVGETV